MSADNWRVCPKCKKAAVADQEKKRKKARDSYGKVGPDDYEYYRSEAEKPLDIPTSLREDYEVGVAEDGEFYAIYSCSCSTCGFEYKFRREERLKL